MKIGILECGRLPDAMSAKVGQYPSMFTQLLNGHGFTFRSWHVEGMDFPDSMRAADGWLITGSRHGAYEEHAFIPVLETRIRDAFAAGVPVVGVCFGHQIMAQALGGRVEKHTGGWVVGAQTYSFDTGPQTLNAWHQDQVVTPPDRALTVAHNSTCAHAALLYPDRGFSVQAHPEFADTVVQGLIDHRGPGVVPEPLLRAAENSLGGADSAPLARRIAEFFTQHAEVRA